MCIYRGTELFMTTWWPNSFEKKIFRENKSNCFCLTKRNSNLLRNLYTWNPNLHKHWQERFHPFRVEYELPIELY